MEVALSWFETFLPSLLKCGKLLCYSLSLSMVFGCPAKCSLVLLLDPEASYWTMECDHRTYTGMFSSGSDRVCLSTMSVTKTRLESPLSLPPMALNESGAAVWLSF